MQRALHQGQTCYPWPACKGVEAPLQRHIRLFSNSHTRSHRRQVLERHGKKAVQLQALDTSTPVVTEKDALKRLVTSIQDTERGLATTKEQLAEISAAVDALEELGQGRTTTGPSLSATWRLLWTTEKETLFILRNASWFGTKAGEVYQVVDVEDNYLQNVITFPPDGAFIVDSDIDVSSDQRINFKFSGAKLKLPQRNLKVPPFGQGWFDTVYLDEGNEGGIRVAKDIRGDTLVVARDGPPVVSNDGAKGTAYIIVARALESCIPAGETN